MQNTVAGLDFHAKIKRTTTGLKDYGALLPLIALTESGHVTELNDTKTNSPNKVKTECSTAAVSALSCKTHWPYSNRMHVCGNKQK